MKTDKIVIIVGLLFLGVANAMSELVVTDFYYDQMDATANTRTTEEYDQNGERCALIKIETTQKDFAFDVGTLGVTKNVYKPGEIWVYVPRSVRRITIQHAQLGVLRNYEFPISIKSGCTYIMKLSTGHVETIVHHAVQQQYLIFQVTPDNAMVEVISDGKEVKWPVHNGMARECVPFGKYQYRISAEGYHTEAGVIELKDPDNAQEVAVKLQPNFGWLRIDATEDLQDAIVYIDNNQYGTVPFVSDRIKSGAHSMSIVKKMYNNYNQMITIQDNDTLTLSPNLEANFADVVLRAADNAEIWVNNEKYGTGTWSGRLEAREYFVETRLPSHRTRDTIIAITREFRHRTFTLPKPLPIYGSLQVETLPNGATIYLNDEQKGMTPKLINRVLIGTHTVRISKANYADYTTTVTVEEGKIAKVEGEMEQSTQEIQTPAPTKTYSTPWYEGGKGMETFVLGEFAYSPAPQMAYGLMVGQTYRGVGWYVQGRSNFHFYDAELACDEEGRIQGELPFYTGKSYSSELMVTAGLVGDILDWAHAAKNRFNTFGFYLGGGYGYRQLYWETTMTDNDKYVLVKYAPACHKGFAGDLGIIGSVHGLTLKVGVSTINFKYVEADFGLGWMF